MSVAYPKRGVPTTPAITWQRTTIRKLLATRYLIQAVPASTIQPMMMESLKCLKAIQQARYERDESHVETNVGEV